jgi:hypothetical protein
MNASVKLTPHDERAVAVRAGCDPRTVRAYLSGRPVRSTVASRVAQAMRERGSTDERPEAT